MTTTLSSEQMKAIVRRHFDDFVNNQRPEVIRVNMAPSFVDHDGPQQRAVGIDEDEAMMRRMYELMPGLEVRIEDLVAEGDMVVCRNVWRWESQADGTPMEFRGFVQWRFEGDKIAERWATVTPPGPATSDLSAEIGG